VGPLCPPGVQGLRFGRWVVAGFRFDGVIEHFARRDRLTLQGYLAHKKQPPPP